MDYRALFAASSNAYMVLDRELRYVDANAAYLALTGSDAASLIGRPIFDVFPNDPADPNNASARLLRRSLEQVRETGVRDVIAHISYRVARSVGGEPEDRMWSATHTPLFDEHGRVAYILQHTQDITDLVRERSPELAASVLGRAAEVQLENQLLAVRLEGLRAMFEQAPGFVAFLRGPAHVFELANAAYDRLVGGRALIGRPIREALPELVDQGYFELLDRVYATGEPFVGRGMHVELERGGRDDESYVDFVYQPVTGADGHALGVLVQGHDVTEQRLATARQEFLTRASEHFATAADDLDGALSAVVQSAVRTFADLAVCDRFEDGASRRVDVAHSDPKLAEAVARARAHPVPADGLERHLTLSGITDKPRVDREITEAMLAEQGRGAEHLEVLRALAPRSLLTVPLWHRGRLFGFLGFGSTRRRFDESYLPAMEELGRIAAAALDNARLNRERLELVAREHAARERAEAANRAKDDFLAMLGHELRNPLAPILTAVQLMRLRGDDSRREQAIIERQAQHMVRLVDDLLDVSRIARGKIELRSAPVELAAVAAKAVEIASPLLDQKSHQLTVEVPGRGLRVQGDEARLTQVIANLLSNAARYTDTGGQIALRAARDGDSIVIRVADNGIGIAPEMLSTIFDLFVQVSRAEGQAGLGLGLTLVRRLVELHGGTVAASSGGAGQGSEFVVRLPALASEDGAPETAAARAGLTVSKRVLIVDDNIDAALLLGELIGRRGHEVAVAHDGASALAEAQHLVPEVAIIDIGLPDLDGYELAGRLTAALGSAAPYMIALTGYGAEHDRARSRRAGFAAHVTKPADAATLLGLIDRGRAAS